MKFLTLLTVAAPALATFTPPELLKRQSDCPIGYKVCGEGCIFSTWTCCPREDGGCPPTSVCGIADNNETGCCPIGRTCTGDAGVDTDYNTWTSTIWSTIEEEPSTTTYSASLPILTLTTETETIVEPSDTSVPPVDLPSPIPTGNATATEIPPIPSGDAAAANGVNLVGGVIAGAAMLLL